MLPQVGQGALAVECRADDADDPGAPGRHRARAQPLRAATPSGPSWPSSAATATSPPAPTPWSTATASGSEGVLASLDGHVVLRHAETGPDPEATGRSVARFLLDDAGGSALLDP